MAAELVEDGNNAAAAWEVLEAVLQEGCKQLLQHLLGPDGKSHREGLDMGQPTVNACKGCGFVQICPQLCAMWYT
jgi:hypothetical protein